MKFYRKKIYSWSKTHKVKCNIAYPVNVDQIIEVLTYAKLNNKKISIMGHGCSHGDLFFYNENTVIINTSKYNNIIDFDLKNKTIKVQSGTSVLKVNDYLFKNKLTITSLPSNHDITLGGALSNNVFGKDSHLNGYFDENIIEIQYIDHQLKIISISKHSQPDKFNQFIGSIGMLGLIINIKLKVKNLQSNILLKENLYFGSLDYFFERYEALNILKKDYHTIKINQFSNNNFEIFVETFSFLKDFSEKIKYYDLNKYKSFNIFSNKFFISKNIYKFFKKITLLSFSIFPNRLWWKLFNNLGFYFFKKLNKKKQHIHILDLLHNNNFSDHNLLFQLSGFYSFQIMIELKNAKNIIKQYLNLVKKYKSESYLSTLKFLPKRNDFIYDYKEHIALEIYTPKKIINKNQKIFINEIIDLIISNKNQIIISKDNMLNKEQIDKIFPKLENFREVKNKIDPFNLFCSAYYARIK